MKTIEPPPRWKSLVEIVTAVEGRDLERFLTPDERLQQASFAVEKRREQWAAARTAARLLAMRRGLIVDPLELEVVVDERRPRAVAGGAGMFLSFSHSGSFAAAALDARPIGIDLEVIRPLHERTAKFFLADRERELLRHESTLLHFWTLKEASFKLVQQATLISEIALRDVTVTPDAVLAQFTWRDLRGIVESERLDDCVLALARAEGL